MGELRSLILSICNNNSRACNDDKYLISRVWRAQGWDSTKPLLDNLYTVASADNIARERRYLHQKGIIKYTKETTEFRYRKSLALREMYLLIYEKAKAFPDAGSSFDEKEKKSSAKRNEKMGRTN